MFLNDVRKGQPQREKPGSILGMANVYVGKMVLFLDIVVQHLLVVKKEGGWESGRRIQGFPIDTIGISPPISGLQHERLYLKICQE